MWRLQSDQLQRLSSECSGTLCPPKLPGRTESWPESWSEMNLGRTLEKRTSEKNKAAPRAIQAACRDATSFGSLQRRPHHIGRRSQIPILSLQKTPEKHQYCVEPHRPLIEESRRDLSASSYSAKPLWRKSTHLPNR